MTAHGCFGNGTRDCHFRRRVRLFVSQPGVLSWQFATALGRQQLGHLLPGWLNRAWWLQTKKRVGGECLSIARKRRDLELVGTQFDNLVKQEKKKKVNEASKRVVEIREKELKRDLDGCVACLPESQLETRGRVGLPSGLRKGKGQDD